MCSPPERELGQVQALGWRCRQAPGWRCWQLWASLTGPQCSLLAVTTHPRLLLIGKGSCYPQMPLDAMARVGKPQGAGGQWKEQEL